MQQTKNYKLNLIDSSDTFSPAPLNENAQKTEAALDALHSAGTALDGAIAAAEGRNCLVKLGTLTAQGADDLLTFDLSGVDLAPFAALLFVVGKTKGSTRMRINGSTNLECFFNGATAYPCAGTAMLFDSGDGHTVVVPYFSNVGGSVTTLDVPLAEIRKITLDNIFGRGSRATLYGIRA